MNKSVVDIIGVPMDFGGNRRGVDMGPSAIRYSGLKRSIIEAGLKYNDCGNIEVPIPEKTTEKQSRLRFASEINEVNDQLYRKVVDSHNKDSFPLIIGGDHSLAVGSTLASLDYYKKIGLIWIDAHADFNTFDTTITGNIHGMPLSAIVGKSQGYLDIKTRGDRAYVDENNVVIIAARDLDVEEVALLKDSNITVFSIQYIDKHGMHNTVKNAIDIASKGTNGVHVSFDIDAISPKEAPGVGTPVKGGLTYREIHLVMELLYECQKMVSLDVVELNPIADNNNMTGNLAVSLIQSALGKNII
jgi:arginase